MNNQVEFWFDFGSTYSYPTAMRINELAQPMGINVKWKAFLLGPLFKQQGWNDSPFKLYPAMGRYMWRDLERICLESCVEFVRPTVFPRNGLLAARIACWYQSETWIAEFSRAVFKANFVADLDIAEPQIIIDILNAINLETKSLETIHLETKNLDAELIIAQATTSESKEKLFQQNEQAKSKGIFGAPSLLVGDELFWGNDRLEQALKWVK